MEYPKPVMSIAELEKMGIADRITIFQWVHRPDQTFAFRNPGGKKWRIDTAEFDEWHEKHMRRK